VNSKLKKCSKCGLPRPIWRNLGNRVLLCKACSSTTGVAKSSKSKPTVVHKPLSRVSSKQSKLEKAYMTLREVFLKEHPMCKAHLPGCTLRSQEIHHSRGRGEYLLDTSTWIPLCRVDHQWIEAHPEESYILEFTQSRLEKDG